MIAYSPTSCVVYIFNMTESQVASYLNLLLKEEWSESAVAAVKLFVNFDSDNYDLEKVKDDFYAALQKKYPDFFNKAATSTSAPLVTAPAAVAEAVVAPVAVAAAPAPVPISPPPSTMPSCCTLLKTPRNNLIYSKLNSSQQEVFSNIHLQLSSSLDPHNNSKVLHPKILTLDAPAGTGKSFIIDAIGNTLNWTGTRAIVFSNMLVTVFTQSPNIMTNTTCKFIMNVFNVPYDIAIDMFSMEADCDILTRLHELTKDSVGLGDTRLLIVDEYSVLEPLFLATLIILAHKLCFNILFIGDRNQNNTIRSRSSNYQLLEKTSHVQFRLDIQMRIVEESYNKIMTKVQEIIATHDVGNGDVMNHDAFKSYIFNHLTAAFFSRDQLLEYIYLTDTHAKIRLRIKAIEKYCSERNIEYKQQCYTNSNKVPIYLPDSNGKFLPYLLLAVGMQYMWYRFKQPSCLVTLVAINTDSVVISLSNKTYAIDPVVLTSFSHGSCPREHFKWISQYVPKDIVIMQYPLRLAAFTYHSVQGLTIDNALLSIDIHCRTINAIYVALTRVTQKDQIAHIHTDNLMGLIYTKYKKDGYLYRFNTYTPEQKAKLKAGTYLNKDESLELLNHIRYGTPVTIHNIQTYTEREKYTSAAYGKRRISQKDYQIPKQVVSDIGSSMLELGNKVNFFVQHKATVYSEDYSANNLHALYNTIGSL
ncbi:helicase 2 [Crangon crangon nudivirus]|uniref:Helicase 2 n=1 Tax=Crangon crangon nudivirus TaxID=2880838 RepID=A0AAE8Y2F5_9VIRU|nr:helicase 2 [Crangon crangon nudivirus]UBZ25562.1 helicase 2 [Crangon crangon nudivirus]